MATGSWSTVEGTLQELHGTPVTVAAAYPRSTLNGTLSCSSLSGTVSYETYIAGQKNLDV